MGSKEEYKDASAWNNEGVALAKVGKYKEAIQCYDNALEINPNDAYYWNNKGSALRGLGRHDEAIECYRKAAHMDISQPFFRNNIGLTLIEAGRYEDAIEQYEIAIRLLPSYPHFWVNKGLALNKLNEYDAAIASFDRALAIDPDNEDAVKGKIASLEFIGKIDDAENLALRFKIKWDRADLRKDNGDDKAIPEIGEVDEENPQLMQIGNQMRARSDLRSSEDLLGFEDYANAFADLIESPYTDPPLTIGIYGSWGIGKSSLLGQITEKLNERHKKRQSENSSPENQPIPQVHIVNFNAWEYSASEVVWPGLVRKIIDQMEPKKLSRGYPRYLLSKFMHNRNQRSRKAVGKIIFVIIFIFLISLLTLLLSNYNISDVWNLLQPSVEEGSQVSSSDNQKGLWAILIALSASGLLAIILGLLQISEYLKPLSQWTTKLFEECDYGKQIGYMEEIHEDLRFLERRLNKRKERILVVIDDLDRCEPSKAVEVLQAINLLLGFKSFIVCLGIDARIITRAVEKHYENLLGPSGASGYEYLEKIVQIPFRIPEPNQDEVTGFIAEQLGKPEPPMDKTTKQTISEKTEPTELTVDEEISTLTHIPFTYDELKAFQSLVAFLRPNPRHIKRLVNVYSFGRTLAKYKKKQSILDNPLITILWLVICGQWPYTTHSMLSRFDKMSIEDIESLSDKDPLIYLFDEVKSNRDRKKQKKKLDHDSEILERLLHENEGLLTWSVLKDLRQFTINFNPAIEAELKFEGEIEEETD